MPLTLRSWGLRCTFAFILGLVSVPSISGERATRIEDIVRLAELRENLTDAQSTAGISTEHQVHAHEAAVSSAALVVDGSARLNARISAKGLTRASANDSRQEVRSLLSGGAQTAEKSAESLREVRSLLSGGAQTAEKSAESLHATNAATSASRPAGGAPADRSIQKVQPLRGAAANTAERPAESTRANSMAAGGLAEKATRSHQEVQSPRGAETADREALAEPTRAGSAAVRGLAEEASAMAQFSETVEALLAEREERSDLHRQRGSRAGGGAASERKEEEPTLSPEQKSAEEKATKEEESTFSTGLGTLSKAITDPRGFLIALPGMNEFAAGIKAAIDLGPDKGKCLASGEFAGFGCGDTKDFPNMCSCAHMFDRCYLPDDPKLTVDKVTKGQAKEAFEEAKTLLFGKCHRSTTIMCIVGVIALLGIFFVLMTLMKVFAKSRPS